VTFRTSSSSDRFIACVPNSRWELFDKPSVSRAQFKPFKDENDDEDEYDWNQLLVMASRHHQRYDEGRHRDDRRNHDQADALPARLPHFGRTKPMAAAGHPD